jgi:hypothetical protein
MTAVAVAELAPPDMDAYEARRITEQIRAGTEVLWALVVEACNRRAWAALGYLSWDAYAAGELNKLYLPPGERTEVVMWLTSGR